MASLSEDIVRGVLRHSVGPAVKDLYMWKPKLFWLQICPEWTRIAKAYVYSEAFIECYVHDSKALNNMHMRPLGGSPLAQKWVSNIDLITQSDCQGLVRRLNLKLATRMDPDAYLDAVLQLLIKYSGNWASVNSVRVETSRQTDYESHEDLQKKRGICRRLAQVVSQVQAVEADCDSRIYSKTMCEFAGCYAESLRSLKLLDIMSFSIPSFAPVLSDLTMALVSAEAQAIPRIFASTLQKLNVYSYPKHFSWSYFQDPLGASKPLRFGQLKELRLNFTQDPSAELPMRLDICEPAELEFPMLRVLMVSGCLVDTCDNILARTHESQVASVVFGGALGAAKSLSRSSFACIDSLIIEISPVAASDEDEFYSVTNRLFGDFAIKHSGGLHIHHTDFALSVGMLQWTSLTSLVLQRPMEFYDVIDLIGALPRLEQLDLAEMRLDMLATEEAAAAFGERLDSDTQPFEAPVEILSLGSVVGECPFHVSAGAVQFLMIKMPMLKQVLVDDYLEEYLDLFVEEYMDEIPHLAEIKVLAT
ncbi:hypothetical protein LPJ57_002127 [Coemansia sp. RSA 486]|nr:hypothetical protein LPJ57_002127 [Coemansia sp. RSA 486]KAJ2237443.1 hypothetical protein IWW45_000973 [Coemansia sp. RSA 485]KAJ2594523.1 hypothetical protein GGF39_004179 [Coemansia sp. RSA 1721]